MIQNIKNGNYKNFYLWALIIFAIFFIFSDLGGKKMHPIDDCYFAQKAKEIIQTGDWFTLRYAGEVSLDQAPFYIWLIAIMFKFFGISEYSARFFSAFFGVATIISIYFLGKMLFDKWVGLFSSLVMLTTLLFFIGSRRAMFDVTFTFWVTLTMIFFMKGIKKRGYFLLFGISTGITILTKSVLGFFPILIAVLYLLLQKEFKKIIDPFFLLGGFIAILISFPWYLYQYINYPEQFVGGHLKWLIYQTAFVRKKVGSPVWYIKKLWIFYWPWIPLATYSFIRLLIDCLKRVNPNNLIILCWTAVFVGVMSFMNIKKIHYLMPAFPALAILTAITLNSILAKEKRKIFFIKICLILFLLPAIIIITTPITLPFDLGEDRYFISDETWSIAMFARENIPENEEVVLYRIWLWRIRSSYLFYSDRDISTSIYDKDSLIKIFKEGRVRYCIINKEDFSELSKVRGLKLHVQKETPSLVLFRASINKENFYQSSANKMG